MPATALLLPVLVQVFLTFTVLILMGRARQRSMVKNRQTLDDNDIRLGTVTWSEDAHKHSRNYLSQFELPVLFYAAVAFALILKQTNLLMIALAWIFVATRVAHTYVHIGSNIVRYRGTFFLIGAVAVLGMWIVLAAKALLGH
jgi:hypothetical protein